MVGQSSENHDRRIQTYCGFVIDHTLTFRLKSDEMLA